ncbi:MAG: NF038122 family metalloprotease, partial [Cyanobacteria bacterium P01_F01_bin.53]
AMVAFQFNFQPRVSTTQVVAMEMAGQNWSQLLKYDVTVNIHVSLSEELGERVIGAAIPVYAQAKIADVQAGLVSDATSADDETASENLMLSEVADGFMRYSTLTSAGRVDSSDLLLTQANAKALGLEPAEASSSSQSVDGYVLFNSLNDSQYRWDYRDGTTPTDSENALDLLSVALQEIGHVLGFVSGLDTTQDNGEPSRAFLLDLFRYSDRSLAQQAQEFSAGQSAYFSIDGGRSELAPFSGGINTTSGSGNSFQASHWLNDGIEGGSQPTVAQTPRPRNSAFDYLTAMAWTQYARNGGYSSSGYYAQPEIPLEQAAFNVASFWQSAGYSPSGSTGFNGVTVADRNPRANPLGVMDPTLAPGERSTISTLDLRAFDVLGYDVAAGALEINDDQMRTLAERAISQRLDLDVADVYNADLYNNDPNTNPLIRDLKDDIQQTLESNADLIERRRRTRVDYSSSFWQQSTDTNTAPNTDLNTDSQATATETTPFAEPTIAEPTIVELNTALLGNQVFEDANGNGRRDRGEIGIAGVQVTLQGAGGDGQFGTTDDITRTAVTNPNGKYRFKELAAGDYQVTFSLLDGFAFTEANAIANDRRDSDADVTTGTTDIISLAVDERNRTVDAGLVRHQDSTPVGAGRHSEEEGILTIDSNPNGLSPRLDELLSGGTGEGAAKLTSFELHQDGGVHPKDAVLGELRLWQDLSAKGTADQGELDQSELDQGELLRLDSAGMTNPITGDNPVFAADAASNIQGAHNSAGSQGQLLEQVNSSFQSAV